jgi:hypothetical protein
MSKLPLLLGFWQVQEYWAVRHAVAGSSIPSAIIHPRPLCQNT